MQIFREFLGVRAAGRFDGGGNHAEAVARQHRPNRAGRGAVIFRRIRGQEGFRLFGGKVLRNGRTQEKIAFGGVSGNFNQIRVIRGVAAEKRDVPAHFFFLLEQQARFGIIAREKDAIRRGGFEFRQNRRVIAFVRRQRVVKDDLRIPFQQGFRFVGQPFGVGRVIVQDGDFFPSVFLRGFRRNPALFIVAGRGSEKIAQPFFGQAHRRRAVRNLDNLVFVVNHLRGFRDGRAIRADDRRDALR